MRLEVFSGLVDAAVEVPADVLLAVQAGVVVALGRPSDPFVLWAEVELQLQLYTDRCTLLP